MKTDYEAPQIEVIEVEVEDVLCSSSSNPEGSDGGTIINSIPINNK